MLNKRIRELRVAQGYSQVALAEKLGVSKQAISNWENNNIQPSIEMLVRMANLFCVTTDYLLGREYTQRINLSHLIPCYQWAYHPSSPRFKGRMTQNTLDSMKSRVF